MLLRFEQPLYGNEENQGSFEVPFFVTAVGQGVRYKISFPLLSSLGDFINILIKVLSVLSIFSEITEHPSPLKLNSHQTQAVILTKLYEL